MNPLSYFLNETMLWGALAAGTPLIIHLFHRAKYELRPWGAMMFLQSSVDARAQSIKLRQWILLALRCLFFLFLAMAMARPITNPDFLKVAPGDKAVTHVLVIDTSCSTQYGNAEAMVFDRIIASAIAITQAMKPDDNMLIIRAGETGGPMFRSPVSDKEFLIRRLRTLKAGYGKAQLMDATMQAFHLLSDCKTASHRIHILTDTQTVNWPAAGSQRWTDYRRAYDLLKVTPAIYVIPHTLDIDIPNIQIVRISQDYPIADIYRRNQFTVDIRNNGQAKRLRVDFFSGDQLESEREITLQTGLNSVRFDTTFNEPGPHYVSARIPGDCLLPDNTYTLALNIVEHIPVLLIEGRSSEDPLASDGGCMAMALTPGGAGQRNSLIAVTSRNQTVMDDIDTAFLSSYKSIILANVSSFSTRFRSRLEYFVSQGGGVFICLGPNVDPDNYNILFKEDGGLMPCLLKDQAPILRPPVVPVFQHGNSADVFTDLTAGNELLLNSVKIKQFHISTPAQDTQILASCSEFPLLAKKSYGKGQVFLLTSTANGDWSNFPFTEDYLPFVQNVVVYMSSNIRPPINLALHETILFSAPVNRRGMRTESTTQSAVLTTPTGEKTQLPIQFDDGRWLGRFDNTRRPGRYSVSFGEQRPSYYSVSLDESEGMLAPLADADLKRVEQDFNAVFLKSVKSLEKYTVSESSPNEIWHLFVLLALGVLTVELILGLVFR